MAHGQHTGDMQYAGDIAVTEAWRIFQDDPRSLLVDVRTRAEWHFVGVPDVGDQAGRLVFVEWNRYPDGQRNPSFVDDATAAGAVPGAPLLLLCRSGTRSQAAAIALTQAGFHPCYNLADGFEGPVGPTGHRDRAGWKTAGLPWRQ